MRSMRTLLKLLGAVTLATLPATTVMACGNNATKGKVLLDKISVNLGLTDNEGKGLKAVNLIWDKDKPVLTISDESNISLSKLLEKDVTTGDVKAKDKESFDFLKNVLQLTVKGEQTFEEGTFDAAEVASITHKVTDVTIKPAKYKAPNDDETLVISDGSYILQFFKADKTTSLGDKYQVKVVAGNDVSALFDIFSKEETSPTKLGNAEFIYAGSPIENFRANALTVNARKWAEDQIVVPLISKERTDKAIKFNNFEELIGWKARFNVKEFVPTAAPVDPTRLEPGDTLRIAITLTKDKDTIALKTTIVVGIN